jgi:hypothetical protein
VRRLCQPPAPAGMAHWQWQAPPAELGSEPGLPLSDLTWPLAALSRWQRKASPRGWICDWHHELEWPVPVESQDRLVGLEIGLCLSESSDSWVQRLAATSPPAHVQAAARYVRRGRNSTTDPTQSHVSSASAAPSSLLYPPAQHTGPVALGAGSCKRDRGLRVPSPSKLCTSAGRAPAWSLAPRDASTPTGTTCDSVAQAGQQRRSAWCGRLAGWGAGGYRPVVTRTTQASALPAYGRSTLKIRALS